MARRYKARITKQDKRIGAILQRARKKLNYTQDDIAGLIKVIHQHLSYIENGHRRPSLVLLRKLSKLLKLSLVELLG